MLLPQDIAEQLTPDEYVELVGVVEDKYHQKFGVVKVTRSVLGVEVQVELDDRTRHDIALVKKSNR